MPWRVGRTGGLSGGRSQASGANTLQGNSRCISNRTERGERSYTSCQCCERNGETRRTDLEERAASERIYGIELARNREHFDEFLSHLTTFGYDHKCIACNAVHRSCEQRMQKLGLTVSGPAPNTPLSIPRTPLAGMVIVPPTLIPGIPIPGTPIPGTPIQQQLPGTPVLQQMVLPGTPIPTATPGTPALQQIGAPTFSSIWTNLPRTPAEMQQFQKTEMTAEGPCTNLRAWITKKRRAALPSVTMFYSHMFSCRRRWDFWDMADVR